MPRNATGNYNLPAGNPVVGGTKIQSSWANTTLQDIATEMSNSLDRQGRAAMTGPLKLADGTAAAPAFTFNSDPNSGVFRIGPDEWALVAGGEIVLVVKDDKLSTPLGSIDLAGSTFDPSDFVPSAGGTFSGDVQFNGAVQFNGPTAVQNRPVFCAMRTSTSQNSGSIYIFPEEKFDYANAYNPTTGAYTIPKSGFYHFNATLQFQNLGAGGGAHGGFVKNGNTGTNGDEIYGHVVIPLATSEQGSLTCSSYMMLAQGDVITCGLYSQFGGGMLSAGGLIFTRGSFSGALLT